MLATDGIFSDEEVQGGNSVTLKCDFSVSLHV